MADTVRVFHAVPAQWEKASFIDFRAEKGVLVSAIRNQGKTSFVQLKSPIATSYPYYPILRKAHCLYGEKLMVKLNTLRSSGTITEL